MVVPWNVVWFHMHFLPHLAPTAIWQIIANDGFLCIYVYICLLARIYIAAIRLYGFLVLCWVEAFMAVYCGRWRLRMVRYGFYSDMN